jgi:GNAT superfamily N-acetyltransferase
MLAIRKGGHRDLEHYYSVIDLDFDKKELLPRLGLHRAISKGDAELLIVYDEESRIELAYALTLCRSLYGYVLLKYFGVLPWYRGKGLGVQAMRLINKYYADRQGILAELTVFDPEDTETMRKLRKFIGRFDYEPVERDYRLGGVEAELLVKPIQGTADITPVAHRLLRDFYSRVIGGEKLEKTVDIRQV